MQSLVLVSFLIACVSSTFISESRLRGAAKLFDASPSASSSAANVYPNNILSFFNIEGAGAYTISGFNSVKATYPPVVPGNGLISTASFAIDPAQKKLVFNQGWSGNQYVFENGTYITLNTSGSPTEPLLCTYLPYVNYDQEVLAVNNITLQDIFYQPSPNSNSQNSQGQQPSYEQVQLYSGIMVDASSCGTMISFAVSTTRNGHIRGIYAAEPFNFGQFGAPTGVAVISSALVFDDRTIVQGVPNPSYFQLPPSCFTPNVPNYCAAVNAGVPPAAICNLYPPIH